MGSLWASVLVAIVSAAIGAVITIQVKYASSEKEAYVRLKRLGGKVLLWGWVCYLIYSLISYVQSPEPVTRAAVVYIAVTCSAIAILVTFSFLERISKIMMKIVEDQNEMAKAQRQLLDPHGSNATITGNVSDRIE